jgi:HD-GYP domain-containing protein (c-di-GMP phosphodiesterase class II)
MKRHLPLHIHISVLFLLLILAVGGLIGGVGYKLSRDMLETAAADATQRISHETLAEFRNLVAPAEMAVNLLSHDAVQQAVSLSERLQRLDLMREALRSSVALSSVYIGYDTGDFFLVRHLSDEGERTRIGAPPGIAYVVQSIEHGPDLASGRHIYLDSSLNILREDERPDYAQEYDPRDRPWFRAARLSSMQIKTAPYRFHTSRKVGTTLAARGHDGNSVIGADIRLETLDAALERQRVTPGSHVVLANAFGQIVAHGRPAGETIGSVIEDAAPVLHQLRDLGIPVLAMLEEPLHQMDLSAPEAVRLQPGLEDGRWRVTIDPVFLEGVPPMFLINAMPERELLAAAIALRSTSALATALIMLLAIPVTWATARAIARPLRALADEADAVRHFDFAKPSVVRSRIKEVDELAVTMDRMKRAIRRFVDITSAVAAEEDFDRLLPMLLAETLEAADSQAGVLYLADEGMLTPAAALTSDGQSLLEGLPAVPMGDAGPLMGRALTDHSPHSGALSARDQLLLTPSSEFAALDAEEGVAVPLLNRRQQLVGAVLLLRREPIGDAQLSFVRALSGSAATSLEARELIKAQKALFEAFIRIIANAIDAKSPYTGGHCARVPELTKMLARAACTETTGPFRDFQLDETGWEAVHIAAWLHDCGKVTTPEYVVDKATKLETLHDRIHEVRMRFEVLKRETEIACLNAIAAGEDAAAASARLATELQRIDDDFAFVATCNEGGEFMSPEAVERLKAIASKTWTRTLDDRIGISQEERLRRMRTQAPTLPVAEPLLADKPEHLVERRPEDHIPEDNPWGFRVTVPELLYNRGEVYNLTVARGTLSEEERFKINEHIIQTEIMLTQLPFPKHLRQVPEIAGGHHEKMDGSGYPKRLKRDEMSPAARMMAIADIFEALTAVDRPYKSGKTLSEAIRIMSFMKQDGHIDPDLFDLFLRAGVYREYAKRYLRPEQIDAVDIDTYLATSTQ